MSPIEQELQKHLVEDNDQTHQQQQEQQQQQQQQSEQSLIMIGQTHEEEEEEREPAHLLEILWRRLTNSKEDKKSDGTISELLKKLCPSGDKGICLEMSKKFFNLKEHIEKGFLCSGSKGKSSNGNPVGNNRHFTHTFRNIKKLKEKGIWLKVSKTSLISDISFQENFFMATLRLAPITVDDFTWHKLMNLIAYEMCPDFKNKFEITSYVSFLDSLIDSRDDVKELRDVGVLQNGLGSDKAVALLFNEISKHLVPNPNLHSDLKEDIQAHCNTTSAIYVAQLYHTYFWSPWSILAFLGALLGLGMTAMQTYQGI